MSERVKIICEESGRVIVKIFVPLPLLDEYVYVAVGALMPVSVR